MYIGARGCGREMSKGRWVQRSRGKRVGRHTATSGFVQMNNQISYISLGVITLVEHISGRQPIEVSYVLHKRYDT